MLKRLDLEGPLVWQLHLDNLVLALICDLWTTGDDNQSNLGWGNLMLSYTRSVFENIMNLWFELVCIMEEVSLNYESDQIIWSFSSSGKS